MDNILSSYLVGLSSQAVMVAVVAVRTSRLAMTVASSCVIGKVVGVPSVAKEYTKNPVAVGKNDYS